MRQTYRQEIKYLLELTGYEISMYMEDIIKNPGTVRLKMLYGVYEKIIDYVVSSSNWIFRLKETPHISAEEYAKIWGYFTFSDFLR